MFLTSEALNGIRRDTYGANAPANRVRVQSAEGEIRILLVDDHILVRQGIRMLLETDPALKVIGEAGTSDEARRLTARDRPAVVILDRTADDDGPDLIAELTMHQGVRVVWLTGATDPEQHRGAIRSGASGVVLKRQAGDVLIKAVRRVHAGELWADRSTTALLLQELRKGAERQDPDSHAARGALLTAREREIVTLVAHGNGTQRIAKTLCISEKTVRNHLASIYSKLRVSDRLELALYAVKHRLSTSPAHKTV